MKSEDREDIQENDLPKWVYHLRLFLKNYFSYLLLVVALLILGYTLWVRHQDSKANELRQAWISLSRAESSTFDDPPAEFRSIISQSASRPLQAFAYAKLGKFYLAYLNAGAPEEGLQGVKVSAAEAAELGRDAFNKVITDYSDQTMALAEARLGMAALDEDLGKWDDARKQYEAILDKSGPLAESSFADVAQQRLDQLAAWSKPALLVGPPASETTTAPATEPTSEPAIAPATLPAAPPTPPAAVAPVIPGLMHPATPSTTPATGPAH